MNVLTNLPLECFEPRERYDQSILSFGPPDRMWVDGTFFPADIEFDASTGTWAELSARLPADWRPDVVLLYWPDQEPIPGGLEDCPVPVAGVVSDYNLTLPYLTGAWPFFDVLLVDRSGVELFQRLSFADVRPFCQFSYKTWHRLYPEVPRDLDVVFAGNLNPTVQRERAPWIQRVAALAERGVRVDVRSGVFGEEYGRFLNRAKIGFNRSIRGEMNLRGFEVPACGGLLLMERDNLEVRDFLEPDEEVVLYGDDDLEDIVFDLLADEPRRSRIARAGHQRVVREHGMSRRLAEVEASMAERGPGRPASTAFERALGRATAMLATWARPETIVRCFFEAADLAPSDPRPFNGLGISLLRSSEPSNLNRAAQLFARACSLSPTYVPAAVNLGWLMQAGGRHAESKACQRELENRLAALARWEDLDGPVLPTGFSERSLAVAQGMRDAVLAGDVSAAAAAWNG